jgi:hypothetical protein
VENIQNVLKNDEEWDFMQQSIKNEKLKKF